MYYRLPRRAVICCAHAFFIFSSVAAHAADDFAVSAAQLQALGVQIQKLDRPAQIEGLTYPAKVVLPPRQVSVVSAPVAGMIDQLLVSENESVRLGQRAYTLGESDLQTLLLVRRQSHDALAAANLGWIEALRARYRLWLDAEMLWSPPGHDGSDRAR